MSPYTAEGHLWTRLRLTLANWGTIGKPIFKAAAG